MGVKNDDEFIYEPYSRLFKSGIVSFSSWIAESATRNQGGRTELKFLTKSNSHVIFSQFYVYGNQQKPNAYNQQSILYTLKMRYPDQEDETLIQYNTSDYTKFTYLNLEKMEQVLEMLDVPIDWNTNNLLTFLMSSSYAYPISFDKTRVIELIDWIMESNTSTEGPPPIKMELVNAEQREGENHKNK